MNSEAIQTLCYYNVCDIMMIMMMLVPLLVNNRLILLRTIRVLSFRNINLNTHGAVVDVSYFGMEKSNLLNVFCNTSAQAHAYNSE